MPELDHEAMRGIAAHCVALVADQFGQHLDGSMDSLRVLDEVCASLLADGPLAEQRLQLWSKLAGAYTGDVVIRAYGGQWIADKRTPGALAISALGVTGFPFSTAYRILSGEPFKSLASFARTLPVISERSAQPGSP